MRIYLLLLCLLFMCTALAQPAGLGKTHGLFFGVNDYSDSPGFDNLKNPIRDAEAIALIMREIYGVQGEVFLNPTQAKIYGELAYWQRYTFGPNDQLFIFLSGHGEFNDFEKKGYFILNNGERIDLTSLERIITQIPCPHIVLAIDACYSGTINRDIAFKSSGFKRPNDNDGAARERLIANELEGISRLVVTSGGKVRTPDGQQHSPFANAILTGLRMAYDHGDGLFFFGDLLASLERVEPKPFHGTLKDHDGGGFVLVAGGRTFPTGTNEMVLIQGGAYQMGMPEIQGDPDEQPSHDVALNAFFLGRAEVTNQEFVDFLNDIPYRIIGTTVSWEGNAIFHLDCQPCPGWRQQVFYRNHHFQVRGGFEQYPITLVTWFGAVLFCNWKSTQNGLDPIYRFCQGEVSRIEGANGYRLPTEAEWEYAARSRGQAEVWSGTSSVEQLKDYAYYNEAPTTGSTVATASLLPNALGLYDMSGNVLEWCWDLYDANYYRNAPRNNPQGPDRGYERVLRGGNWYEAENRSRTTNRAFMKPHLSTDGIGFRLARDAR